MPLPAIYLIDAENQPIGPFTPEQIGGKLARQEIKLEDLAFSEGATDWAPLHEVLLRFAPDALAPPGVTTAVPNASISPQFPLPPDSFVYASFMERLYASSMDTVVVALPTAILTLLTLWALFNSQQSSTPPDTDIMALTHLLTWQFVLSILGDLLGMLALYGLASWLYEVLLDSGPNHATLGKRMFHLKVVTLNGQPISFMQATGRYLIKLISNLFLFSTGHLFALFTPRRQALHDLIAGTVVIKDYSFDNDLSPDFDTKF